MANPEQRPIGDYLTEEDNFEISDTVWYSGEVGKLNIQPISIEIQNPEIPIRVKQYPIALEGRKGLKPVVENSVHQGVLESCVSPHNTPILPVKKPDGSYRLVQDLRAVDRHQRRPDSGPSSEAQLYWNPETKPKIEEYTQVVKFLYEKLTEEDNIKWTKEDNDKLEKLKLKLASIPALSLPSLEKPFHLYVNVEKGVAHGVLVQEWGGVKRPVAYLSKMLDPVSHSWPVCIQAIAATAILVEESRKLTFGGQLIVCTPHAVRNVLNQKAGKWLTDSRMLKYEAILIDSDDLTLEVNKILNPAQFLYGEPADNLIHNCLEIIQYQTKVQGDLKEQALSEGEIIYVDRSSRCLQGKRMSGYAVVDGKNMQTIEKGRLPST
ncbi:hypothetical protein DUI87_32768 [Hirundo rustica rustica]|uniref:Reverse transcriptase/retrotransposon-derived protein RNase H-like domain-containing protein n=1 Tax=Hirundo rustica rustica TaxID=333673 RepID=A0A3M0IPW7_HIRRU|nr:hypothetical protein DUI87_32768 [Hirundo rustica rustica]